MVTDIDIAFRYTNIDMYYGSGNTTLNHDVLVVSYGIEEFTHKYWIFKNSRGYK
jgi:hypothetical protein